MPRKFTLLSLLMLVIAATMPATATPDPCLVAVEQTREFWSQWPADGLPLDVVESGVARVVSACSETTGLSNTAPNDCDEAGSVQELMECSEADLILPEPDPNEPEMPKIPINPDSLVPDIESLKPDFQPCEGGTSSLVWTYELWLGGITYTTLPRNGMTAGSESNLVWETKSGTIYTGSVKTKAPLDTIVTSWHSGLQASQWVFLDLPMTGDVGQTPSCQKVVAIADLVKSVTVRASGSPVGLPREILNIVSEGKTCITPC